MQMYHNVMQMYHNVSQCNANVSQCANEAEVDQKKIDEMFTSAPALETKINIIN